MKKKERRQLQWVCNHFQKRIMLSLSLALLLSILFFSAGFFSIHFYLNTANKEVIPLEDIRLILNRTALILVCLIPVLLCICWTLSWRVTYRTVGALERLTLELQKRIKTSERTPIRIRKGDGIHPLVEGINHLLAIQERNKRD
jgi:hypothetical protein